jgi:copper chaperone CopZ
MQKTYKLTGMTCSSCEAAVKISLEKVPGISQAKATKDSQSAVLTMDKEVDLTDLQMALGGLTSKYQISELKESSIDIPTIKEEKVSWITTYKPILLIFGFILGSTLMIQVNYKSFDLMQWMQQFMAGFFLVFSFFKLLDVKGFANSYKMYDVIAKSFPIWGFIYPFIELSLGMAYLINYNPFVTNIVTLILMSLSIIGVLQSVLNKKEIKCACLGSVFNLPMSSITIIEDGIMIAMSLIMLILIK